jgi:hypothetical protein
MIREVVVIPVAGVDGVKRLCGSRAGGWTPISLSIILVDAV